MISSKVAFKLLICTTLKTKLPPPSLSEFMFLKQDIMNHSFTTDTFLNLLKVVKVTTLHKKGATGNVNHYKLAAQHTGLSKIFEKLFHNRLLEFTNKNFLLSNNQHSFRQSRSTTTAVYELLHAMLKAIDEKKMASGIFLDLSKAFDIIEHNAII
ncbi:uncharacterized protein LOC124775406 [Schistocerca piceifrons]|uniref:uncharacterized protein LOC124775406 n=1 Tax=Schistocerca piceifrons TaxID=274613 RepID=UPI001F5ECB00|nr:uncharacterized protein LOC124775406 [Schistocerca piceifrons]